MCYRVMVYVNCIDQLFQRITKLLDSYFYLCQISNNLKKRMQILVLHWSKSMLFCKAQTFKFDFYVFFTSEESRPSSFGIQLHQDGTRKQNNKQGNVS